MGHANQLFLQCMRSLFGLSRRKIALDGKLRHAHAAGDLGIRVRHAVEYHRQRLALVIGFVRPIHLLAAHLAGDGYRALLARAGAAQVIFFLDQRTALIVLVARNRAMDLPRAADRRIVSGESRRTEEQGREDQ